MAHTATNAHRTRYRRGSGRSLGKTAKEHRRHGCRLGGQRLERRLRRRPRSCFHHRSTVARLRLHELLKNLGVGPPHGVAGAGGIPNLAVPGGSLQHALRLVRPSWTTTPPGGGFGRVGVDRGTRTRRTGLDPVTARYLVGLDHQRLPELLLIVAGVQLRREVEGKEGIRNVNRRVGTLFNIIQNRLRVRPSVF